MQIVVNAGILSKIYREDNLNFLAKTFEHITRNNPEHNFVFLCERDGSGLFSSGTNVKLHIIKDQGRNPWIWKFWYDIRLPAILRKHRADVFVSTSGICSLTSKLPQCMIIEDQPFLQFPAFFTRTQLLFYKTYQEKFIRKAKRIVSLSSFSIPAIVKSGEVATDKIDVIFNGINETIVPLAEEAKKAIKEKYSGGKDFFMYSGMIHPSKNLINLMKAFSLFKKRQQSNMKLVLCGKPGPPYASFAQSLATYKYKADVVYLPDMAESEMLPVMASAYALVYPVFFDAFSTPVLQAMRCRVPVITTGGSLLQEITGGAAIYCDPGNYDSIAAQLMRLYKDENLRNELIAKGEPVSHLYQWQKAAGLLWHTIQKSVL